MTAMALAFRLDAGRDLSLLVSRMTGKPVHVAMLFDDVCIEAVPAGVRQVTTASRLAHGEWVLVPVPVTPEQAQRALAFATSLLGARYDWFGVWCTWWLGRIARNGHPRWWFCSELAVATLLHAGVEIQPARAGRFTPRRLWRTVAIWVG